MSTVDYDPLSTEAMTDPHRLYALLRAHDPVHHLARYDTWALASFGAVWQACSDTDSFSVRRGQIPYQILLGEPATNLTFPELDPPEHRLRRRVLAPGYTREAAERDVATIRDIARTTLDAVLDEHGTCFDAHRDYANVVAGRVAARKAGVPLEDADRLRRQLAGMFHREPGQRGTSEANGAAAMEAFGYLHALVAEARSDPARASGMLATLLDATVDGVPLADDQIAAELHTLMVTGSDTSELGVAAALYHLQGEPAQRDEVIGDPTQSVWAFAEALRFDHPTDVLCRSVRRDVTVEGRRLREGQGVLLLWGSANRDEAEFPDAGRFDMHRRPARSLVFGHGQHQCIGEHIGMRMGAVMLEVLFSSISGYDVDIAGTGRRCGEFLKGFNRLPVEVTLR